MKIVFLILYIFVEASAGETFYNCFGYTLGKVSCNKPLSSYQVLKVDPGASGRRGSDGSYSFGTSTGKRVMASLAEHDKKLANLNKTVEEVKKLWTQPLGAGRSCKEILKENPEAADGVYKVTSGSGVSIDVYCDMTGGGWIVFQRRFDGSTDFKQNFQTYVDGFGDLTGEHWLGLKHLHELTKTGHWDLRVDLESFHRNIAYEEYTFFEVREGPGYRLRIDDYSGTAGDGLGMQRGMKFSSYDLDQDNYKGFDCSNVYLGAWWFNGCHSANLNAFDYGYKGRGSGKTMCWRPFLNGVLLKKTVMKLRPR